MLASSVLASGLPEARAPGGHPVSEGGRSMQQSLELGLGMLVERLPSEVTSRQSLGPPPQSNCETAHVGWPTELQHGCSEPWRGFRIAPTRPAMLALSL
mmetsp:Transcript_26201/g.57633  ORF Transcript_26201/g.57633 Transcript_26201/m.57633 type:complete len:99 (-) Transcript_26201:1406-1702(-)